MTTHLVIPDPHAHPDFNNDRFTYVGQYIVEHKPDVIICLGDLADMPSLCSYERGTGKFEGRRYNLDVQANRDANAKLFAPIEEYNARQRANGKRQYRPRTILLYGNHEDRISRAVNQDPVLQGTIGLEDLQNEQYWGEVIPFLTPINVDGIFYCHYFTSGVMGRAISSEHTGYQLIQKQHASCTAGHLHTFDYCQRTRADGHKMHGLVAGSFYDYHADYAGPANNLWWNGLVLKRNVHQGDYDFETISMKRLKEMYSNA